MRLAVELLEDRTAPSVALPPVVGGPPPPPPPPPVPGLLAVGAGVGGGELRVFDPGTREPKLDLFPFGAAFAGGVNVAVGDFDLNRDGVPDLIAAPMSGAGPRVVVLDGATGAELRSFIAFEPSFTGGLNLALGPVTPGGPAVLVVGAGFGGGPRVAAFDPGTGAKTLDFFAYDPSFRGGVSVALSEPLIGTDAVLVTGAGPGGGPHVRVFDPATGAARRDFFAFDPSFRGGVNVAAGWLGTTTAGVPNVAAAAATGGSRVVILDGTTGAVQSGFDAFDAPFAGGVRLARFGSVLLAGAGPGGGPRVSAFYNPAAPADVSFFAFDPSFAGGVSVAEVPTKYFFSPL